MLISNLLLFLPQFGLSFLSMRALDRLFHKEKKLVIGLMSGTSADGVDAVITLNIIKRTLWTKNRNKRSQQ